MIYTNDYFNKHFYGIYVKSKQLIMLQSSNYVDFNHADFRTCYVLISFL